MSAPLGDDCTLPSHEADMSNPVSELHHEGFFDNSHIGRCLAELVQEKRAVVEEALAHWKDDDDPKPSQQRDEKASKLRIETQDKAERQNGVLFWVCMILQVRKPILAEHIAELEGEVATVRSAIYSAAANDQELRSTSSSSAYTTSASQWCDIIENAIMRGETPSTDCWAGTALQSAEMRLSKYKASQQRLLYWHERLEKIRTSPKATEAGATHLRYPENNSRCADEPATPVLTDRARHPTRDAWKTQWKQLQRGQSQTRRRSEELLRAIAAGLRNIAEGEEDIRETEAQLVIHEARLTRQEQGLQALQQTGDVVERWSNGKATGGEVRGIIGSSRRYFEAIEGDDDLF